MPRALLLNRLDNVATLLDPGRRGESCEIQGESAGALTLAEDIPFGHKVCISATGRGATIVKYGQAIGKAIHGIEPGQHVHSHNLESSRGRGDIKGSSNA